MVYGNILSLHVWFYFGNVLLGCGYLQDPEILNSRPKSDFPKYPWL